METNSSSGMSAQFSQNLEAYINLKKKKKQLTWWNRDIW